MIHPERSRHVNRKLFISAAVLVGAAFVYAPAALSADTTEFRDYVITVDGKTAGGTKVKITKKDNGVTEVDVEASVRVKILITYTFKLTGKEWWKDGKLYYLNVSVNDNGKRKNVSAVGKDGELQVRVNGSDSTTQADVWTSSYWKLPDQKYHNKKVAILQSDEGTTQFGILKYIGTEKVSVNGQPQSCYHFRITGNGPPNDLWFDKYYRLVRREFMERNHRTVIQLISVRR